jgi:hypothetical protein
MAPFGGCAKLKIFVAEVAANAMIFSETPLPSFPRGGAGMLIRAAGCTSRAYAAKMPNLHSSGTASVNPLALLRATIFSLPIPQRGKPQFQLQLVARSNGSAIRRNEFNRSANDPPLDRHELCKARLTTSEKSR